jgi:uncharacterized protein YodC (DUF2158 family)
LIYVCNGKENSRLKANEGIRERLLAGMYCCQWFAGLSAMGFEVV